MIIFLFRYSVLAEFCGSFRTARPALGLNLSFFSRMIGLENSKHLVTGQPLSLKILPTTCRCSVENPRFHLWVSFLERHPEKRANEIFPSGDSGVDNWSLVYMRAAAITEDLAPIKSGKWTDQDINTLIQLWSQGLSNAAIGEKLRRQENAVAVKASRLKLPPKSRAGEALTQQKNKNSKAKVRNCLRCRSQFFSEGPGNRICDLCKSGSDWSSGGSYTTQFSGNY
ncbi:MAG: GcrA family cell cycle regulator [Roseibium sp.]|uniref:GcrA family cell cycle regulator n=1 Tax=Roseibium sp. TaxID=1936156 RepID=UPI0032984C27